ncbi:MAG TPA: 23S rRNA (guanosine(2251)-2'-O)-methyltransferase RlmB [Saprospiraceae bacterium]|nr:23S rRNA (guanosine(2251)-2'-O)-methyltransferase RlmB [Saprospiraceae bacterium]HMQ84176.1 23S rRNA (guanosine(2251)-2'-O)-methyltransferase RlmB [Saprospiraceae bacterium]
MDKDNIILFGRHPVKEALESGVPIDKVVLQQGIRGEFEKEMRHLCKQFQVPLQVVPKEGMNRISRGNHQGVMALQSPVPFYKIDDLLPGLFEQSKIPLLLLLDGITDVRNFGAIARTAECCGAHALVISMKKSASVNAEAMKTSAGALNKIPVCREGSLVHAIEYLQLCGICVIASDLKATKALFEMDMKQGLAIVLGSEGEGISPAIAEKANELFVIPQLGTTDSLNVSVAAGMMLYEVMRQRMG